MYVVLILVSTRKYFYIYGRKFERICALTIIITKTFVILRKAVSKRKPSHGLLKDKFYLFFGVALQNAVIARH